MDYTEPSNYSLRTLIANQTGAELSTCAHPDLLLNLLNLLHFLLKSFGSQLRLFNCHFLPAQNVTQTEQSTTISPRITEWVPWPSQHKVFMAIIYLDYKRYDTHIDICWSRKAPTWSKWSFENLYGKKTNDTVSTISISPTSKWSCKKGLDPGDKGNNKDVAQSRDTTLWTRLVDRKNLKKLFWNEGC